jgi:hypothetical protein
MKRLSVCLAATTAAAALALPASAGAAEKFYGGKINNGGKIGIEAELVNGKPIQILAMRYKNLVGDCEGTPSLLEATWTFNNFVVDQNRFATKGADPSGDHRLLFRGTFRQQGRKVEGQIKEGPSEFNPGPVTCTSPKRGYAAKRGAGGPHPQKLKAKVGSAFRVAR